MSLEEEQDSYHSSVTSQTSSSTPHFSLKERLEGFQEEWLAFLRKQITDNFGRYYHLWMGIGSANRAFLVKMNKLANKYFRGVLTDESLTRLNIYVKHLQYGMTALYIALKENEMSLPIINEYVEAFTKESFEHMGHWNWVLTQGDETNLVPFQERDLVVEEERTAEQNHGFPPWIHVSIGGSDECSECSDCSDCEYEEESSPKEDT